MTNLIKTFQSLEGKSDIAIIHWIDRTQDFSKSVAPLLRVLLKFDKLYGVKVYLTPY